MKILLAAHQFFPEHYAGVETLTLGLAQGFKARGHDAHVFAAKRSFPVHDIEPGETEDYEYAGIPVRRVGRPTEGLGRPFALNYRSEMMAERAREYVREVRPDIVHAMHLQGLTASVIPAFKEFGVPIVYTATDFWTVCPVVDLRRHDGVMCEGPELVHCTRCIASRHPGVRMKTAVNLTPDVALRVAGGLSETPLSDLSRSLRQVRALKERPERIKEKIELVDHIIAPTRITRDLLVSNGVGTGKIQVSYYGIDTSGIRNVRRNQALPLRVGFMGTIAPHKGCDVLIRAFKELPPELDATLTIHGNLERFEAFAQELRTLAGEDERITFAGPFPREGLSSVLSETDVLVVPSRWYENGPIVIFEAFAAGVPVIATGLRGMSEFVKHEENGLLFELEDASDLARQLRRLVDEPGLLERLRDGIKPVKTVEENVDELEALYASLPRERSKKA